MAAPGFKPPAAAIEAAAKAFHREMQRRMSFIEAWDVEPEEFRARVIASMEAGVLEFLQHWP